MFLRVSPEVLFFSVFLMASCRCIIQVLWFLAVHHSSAILTARPFDFLPLANPARVAISTHRHCHPPLQVNLLRFLLPDDHHRQLDYQSSSAQQWWNWYQLLWPFATGSKPVSKCKSVPLDLSSTIWVDDSRLMKINSLLYKMRRNFAENFLLFDIWPLLHGKVLCNSGKSYQISQLVLKI